MAELAPASASTHDLLVRISLAQRRWNDAELSAARLSSWSRRTIGRWSTSGKRLRSPQAPCRAPLLQRSGAPAAQRSPGSLPAPPNTGVGRVPAADGVLTRAIRDLGAYYGRSQASRSGAGPTDVGHRLARRAGHLPLVAVTALSPIRSCRAGGSSAQKPRRLGPSAPGIHGLSRPTALDAATG